LIQVKPQIPDTMIGQVFNGGKRGAKAWWDLNLGL